MTTKCLCVSSSLVELERGIKGLVVMSSSLEESFHCIHDARVPPLWEKVPDTHKLTHTHTHTHSNTWFPHNNQYSPLRLSPNTNSSEATGNKLTQICFIAFIYSLVIFSLLAFSTSHFLPFINDVHTLTVFVMHMWYERPLFHLYQFIQWQDTDWHEGMLLGLIILRLPFLCKIEFT